MNGHVVRANCPRSICLINLFMRKDKNNGSSVIDNTFKSSKCHGFCMNGNFLISPVWRKDSLIVQANTPLQNLFNTYTSSKAADQHAHSHSLISNFIPHLNDRLKP